MDRQVIYPGQVPIETDLLKTNQNVMVALAKLSEALFGTSGVVVGFGTTQTVVPSMAVLIAPGEIYAQQNLEASPISSLAQDLAHSIVKQGISLDPLTLSVAAPGTAGFSVNYLVQVGYQDADSGQTVLPYYNASNPSVAYSGPANSGAAQPTVRQGAAVVSIKAGIAATSGSQATPAPDSGKLGLFVVTVASGSSSVTNANISAYPGASVLGTPMLQGRYLRTVKVSSSGTYVPGPGARLLLIRGCAAGSGGAGAPATGSGTISFGTGGMSGAYAEFIAPAVPTPVIVGAAGAAGGAGGAGGVGGNSAWGSLVLLQAGVGGSVQGPTNPPYAAITTGTALVSGSLTPTVAIPGSTGTAGISQSASLILSSGGGVGPLGSAGTPTQNGDGILGSGWGVGGGGASNSPNNGARPGGAGTQGGFIVEEFA
ncbi:MAG: hypothetical protein ACRYGA_02425 [Janthinobacterium lividum]